MNAPRRHPLANADIEREARWYDAHQPGLGTDFVDEVKRMIGLIAEQPLRCGVRFGHWRRANLRRFPHAVFYQILDGQPVIFAVLHAKRDHRPLLEGRRPAP
jgi:plasmid stabilization system protein ParE